MVTKVSDITNLDIAEYLRLIEPSTKDLDFISTCINVAKDYIVQYTGLKSSDLDNYTDLIIVVYVLVQDMYDTRTLYIDGDSNLTVSTILGLHQRNLL